MSEKILIVEADPTLQETLAYNLTHQGYLVEATGDGHTAIEMARQNSPDLIVLDIMLPVLDGFEVCRTLRQESKVNDNPISLNPKEFEFLLFLAKHLGQVLTRELILDRVWGWDFHGGSRTVDVHLRWLREKIEIDPAQPVRIITVRGAGYRFEG